MDLKDLLISYQNDFDKIREVYLSNKGTLYHIGYLSALEKIIKDLEEEEAKIFLIEAIGVGTFFILLRPAIRLFLFIYVLLGGVI